MRARKTAIVGAIAIAMVVAWAPPLPSAIADEPVPGADLTLGQEVRGLATDWVVSFNVAIDNVNTPGPNVNGVGEQRVSETRPGILVPGSTYTVLALLNRGNPADESLICSGSGSEPVNATQVGEPSSDTWEFTYVADMGEITCDFVDEFAPGVININKTTSGGVGTFDFTVAPNAGGGPSQDAAVATTVAGETATTAVEVPTGVSYTVTEDAMDGWLANSPPCTVEPQPGETVNCDFFNTATATVTLNKVNESSAPGPFTFIVNGEDESPIEVVAGEPETFTVPAGTVTIEELAIPGVAISSAVCGTGVTLQAGLEFSFVAEQGSTVQCTVTNSAALTVDKTVRSVNLVGGNYEVTWDIAIANGRPAPVTVDIDDELSAPSVISFVSAAAEAVPAISLSEDWDGDLDTRLASNVEIPAGGTQNITVRSRHSTDGDIFEDAFCEEGGGVTNSVTVQGGLSIEPELRLNGVTPDFFVSDSACADLVVPDLDLGKWVSWGPELEDGVWSIGYEVGVDPSDDVSNVVITDTPDFASGLVPTRVLVDGDEVTLADDGSFVVFDGTVEGDEVFEVVIEFEASLVDFDEDVTSRSFLCDGPGTGLFNEVVATIGGVEAERSNDCADAPEPEIELQKQVSGYRYVDADTIDVDFTVDVTNSGGPSTYFFLDAAVPQGAPAVVVPTVMTLTSVPESTLPNFEGPNTFPTDPDLPPAWAFIGAGALQTEDTESWAVTVRYDVDIDADVESDVGICIGGDGDPTRGTGALNIAVQNPFFFIGPVAGRVVTEAEEPPIDLPFAFTSACLDLARVSFDKQVDNRAGGTRTPADFTLELVDGEGAVERRIAGGTTAVVVVGEYTAREVPVAGYVSGPVTCRNLPVEVLPDQRFSDVVAADRVVATPGSQSRCAAVNVSFVEPTTTLEASMSVSPTGRVAAGSNVTFTLNLRNVGPANVRAGITMTNVLPAGLTFVSVSAPGWNCTGGQTVTCTLPTALPAASSAPPITLVAKIAATASGTITNVADFSGVVESTVVIPPFLDRTEDQIVTAQARGQATATFEVVGQEPPAPPTTVPPPGRLPATGGGGAEMVAWALTVFVLGGALLLATRRRIRTI